MSKLTKPITIIGAGLVGALLATLLAQRGFKVRLFERWSDPRLAGYTGGRSINLALAERGLNGLRLAGLSAAVMQQSVMMRGRMVHDNAGLTNLQRYGRDDSEVIWSVNRGRLNMTLLDAAEAAGVAIDFSHRLDGARFGDTVALRFHNERSNAPHLLECPTVIGADGAGSALRAAMNLHADLGERFEPLGHAYKELAIPALAEFAPASLDAALQARRAQGEKFAIEANALHIWPRGGYMLIALPNVDGSFTVTLFLPNTGEPSFSSVTSASAVEEFFARDFADAVPLLPQLVADFMGNPIGLLGTLRLRHWHLGGRALLIGDAAHAIVPFHGQGMNCGFEDAVELADLMAQGDGDLAKTYAEFEERRKPQADAIADMALENYVEMRDSVADRHYLLCKQIERVLADRHPGCFIPRYAMVMFSRLPYALAQSRGAIQFGILDELARGISTPEQVDLALADRLVAQRLPILPAELIRS